jgi:hypothetical protein
MRGRHLFEKRLSSPHPIFQKLSGGIAFIVPIKTIPTFGQEYQRGKTNSFHLLRVIPGYAKGKYYAKKTPF